MAEIKTRFDRITKVKAHSEERARVALRGAHDRVEDTRSERDQAHEEAYRDERLAGDCASWMLSDLSHMRALNGLSHAEDRLVQAEAEVAERRSAHTDAYKDLRVFENLVAHRREAVMEERRRAEQNEFDEIASMLFTRNRNA